MDRRFFTKATLGLIAGSMASQPIIATPKTNDNIKGQKSESPIIPQNDEAEEQIKVIQSKRFYKHQGKNIEGKCTSLLFFADVHLVPAHLIKIRDFFNKHKKYIDDTIHLGDSVGDFYTGEFTLWDNFPKALNVIGNHDTDAGKNRRCALTDNQKYDIYFKKYISGWKVKQPENAESEGKCYWYKDYNKDLRVIGIDCMRLNDAQYKWFAETLDGAAKKNLKVIIVTHIPPHCNKAIECNFTSLDYLPSFKSNSDYYSKLISAVDAFISNGGTFVSWICGHNHHDSIMYTGTEKNKQLVIVMECATDFSWWTDAVHIPNTATETCWEIISVESISNVIKIARFGNNYDHYLRHKGTFCYDFKNHKVISQS